MTIDFAAPFITGLFVGGIATEVRWMLRLRQFQGQLRLKHSAELQKTTVFAQAEAPSTPEVLSSLGLRSLHEHVVAERGATPIIEPAGVGTHDA